MKNSLLETNLVMDVTVSKFRKLKGNSMGNYRGKCTVTIGYEYEGELIITTYDNVICSGLVAYRLSNLESKSKYLGVTFSSLTTSPIYWNNPFKLVKWNDKYYLYFVHQNGHKDYEVVMPGGVVIPRRDYLYYKPSEYIRYLDLDYINSLKTK